MAELGNLKEIEGLNTIEMIAEKLGITRNSALNLVVKLKKEGYATTKGGGRQKRLYRITTTLQRKRSPGMFDIINRHSPMKLAPWYDHQVHGPYGVEETIVDAVQTESFRVILASLNLFNHVTDWKRLYNLANETGVWQKIGAMYDVARLHIRVRRMPEKYTHRKFHSKMFLIKDYRTKEEMFIPIEAKWKVAIPFRKGDMVKAIYDNT